MNIWDKSKTFAVFSLGCRTNQAEILQLAALLEKDGLKFASKPDLILVNTCAVTQKALAESKRTIKQLKKQNPQAKIVVLGCGVNFSPQQFSFADAILTNQDKDKILRGYSVPSFKVNHPFPHSRRFLLRIQSGCQHFCTYCVVPFLRKKNFSLPPSKAVEMIKKAEQKGYQEVVLTGTNLGLYGLGKNFDLSDLIKEILAKTAIPRISFGSINIEAINKKFVHIFSQAAGKRLSRYLHIPLQSGSNKILKLMNRPYTVEEYQKTINSLIRQIPFLGIGTDIIVGFPGETQREFRKTLSFLQKTPFSRLHVFRFSPREKTLAALQEKEWGKVGEEEKKRRASIIRRLGEKKQTLFRQKIRGKIFPVLFLEKVGVDQWYGLTDNYVPVIRKSKKKLKGRIQNTKII